MDRLAHAAANSAIGNDRQATTIEVSRGGIDLDCITGSITLGIAGGGCVVNHRGRIESARVSGSACVPVSGAVGRTWRLPENRS
jgi:allophanate hydrolase subunit 2